MNQDTFARLVELSALSDTDREAVIARTQPRVIHDYLDALNRLGRLNVPAPSPARKWGGRVQLLEAVEAYHSRPSSSFFSAGWLRELRGATVAVASALVIAAVAAGSSIGSVPGSDAAFSEVLSALGLRHSQEVGAQPANPEVPVEVPGFLPEVDVPISTPAVQDDAALNDEESETLDEGADQPVALPPRHEVDPPGQGGENPGQGMEPPGHGGENPGQGVEPPGQGGENPGQGTDPPGQGGENPGQGGDPPGQGGENTGGQGGSQGQSGGGSGQGADPPGLGDDNPGQGQGNGGEGNGNSNKP